MYCNVLSDRTDCSVCVCVFFFFKIKLFSCCHLQVPRLFVNVVPPMDVSSLYELHQQDTKSCQILGW